MKSPAFNSLILITLVVAARVDAATLTPTQIDQMGRRITAYMSANHIPGLSIALVVDGEPAWASAYGIADLENDVLAKVTTAYRTASIGKTMTATAAMQLVEQGKLDLDADIRRYCPVFPAKPQTITTRQLLSHLSGIRHYGGPRDEEEQSSTTRYKNVADALAPFKTTRCSSRLGRNSSTAVTATTWSAA